MASLRPLVMVLLPGGLFPTINSRLPFAPGDQVQVFLALLRLSDLQTELTDVFVWRTISQNAH
jgi:hypothetical protein